MIKIIIIAAVKAVVIIGAGLLLVVMLLELAVGCGQVTYSQDRTWRSNECLFITSEEKNGRW